MSHVTDNTSVSVHQRALKDTGSIINVVNISKVYIRSLCVVDRASW